MGYRASVRRRARQLHLVGWVRNEADGSVSAVAEGTRDGLAALQEFCRRGPPMARVDGLEASLSEATGEFVGFEIRRAPG